MAKFRHNHSTPMRNYSIQEKKKDIGDIYTKTADFKERRWVYI